jgi:hypothetical protein
MERTIAVVQGWRGGLRQALNAWKTLRELVARRKVAALRWVNYKIFRLWRRWSVVFMGRMRRLQASVKRWSGSTITRAVNTWSARASARISSLQALSRAVATLRHQKQACTPATFDLNANPFVYESGLQE